MKYDNIPERYRTIMDNAAARGAKRLDRKVVNWHKQVKLGILSIASSCNCVMGQIAIAIGATKRWPDADAPDWMDGLIAIRDRDLDARRYGFMLPESVSVAADRAWHRAYVNDAPLAWSHDDAHRYLTEAWRREIRARRNGFESALAAAA